VAYTCNPSYSGGRDQEDHGSKPDQIVLETLSKKPSQKRASGVAQGVSPVFKPQYFKNKNKKVYAYFFFFFFFFLFLGDGEFS
jgi:hypothetical protein